MACVYTYKGKEYDEDGIRKALSEMTPSEAAPHVHGVESVPDAPFVGSTASWSGLAMKRMIRKAAEEGYDKLTFTKGDTQADRYDLSKQVDQLLYSKNPDGTYRVSAITGGRGNMLGENIPESKLEENVGKDVAKRIVDGEGKRTEVQGKDGDKDYMQSLSGVDLKVGGEGMRAFYDKMLPNEVNKYVKRWGAKVSESEIPTTISKSSYLDDLAARSGEPREPESTVKVHSLDITPEMRKAALEGQPLFSRKDLHQPKDGVESANKSRKDQPDDAGRAGQPASTEDDGRDGRGGRAAVEAEEGKPGQVRVSGVHFSAQQRPIIRGQFHGTGLKGEEARRLAGTDDPRLRKRVYAYVNEGNEFPSGKGVNPERGVGAFPHAVELKNLYDLNSDPLDLQKPGDQNAEESAILDHGFDGYYVKGAYGKQGGAVLLGKAAKKIDAKLLEPDAQYSRKERDDEVQGRAEGDSGSVSQAADAGRVSGRGGLPGADGSLEQSYRAHPGDDLAGLPSRIKVPGHGTLEFHGSGRIQDAARGYMKKAGLPYDPPKTYAKVDPVRAAKIADEYAAMKHDPSDPEVAKAYDKMIEETKAQYQAALDSGLKVEFIDGPDPYKETGPRGAIMDVVQNNHLWVYPTDAGFGSSADFDPSKNPLLAKTDFEISGRPALANDLFRTVHDVFGHIKEGLGFRSDGEENAWRAHSAMYSPEARRAMTSETRGQNSWVNFGEHGEHNRTADSEKTIFADQKTGLLPKWVSEEGVHDAKPYDPVDFSRSTTTFDNQTKQMAAGIDMNNDEQLRAVGRGSIGHAFAVKQRVSIQTEKALNGWRDHFDKMMSAGQKGIDAIRQSVHEWETGKKQSNPALAPFYDSMKKAFDQRVDAVVAGGRQMGYLSNYFPHLYKDPKKAKDWINDQMSKAPLEGGKGWTKERFYQTLEGARQAGLETISENPADMAQAHLNQLDKYLALHQIKTDLDARGLTVKDDPDALRKPEGWDSVRDPAFQGKLLPDIVAKDLNTILGPSLNSNATFRGFRKVENALVSAALGLSGFHATMTTGDTIASHIGDGIQRAADGDIAGAIKSLGAALVSPVISPIKGAAYKKLSIGETPTGLFTGMLGMNKPADAHTAALLRMLEQGGHQVSMSPTELNDSLTKLNRLRHQAQYKLIPALLKSSAKALASGQVRDAATHAAEAAHIPWEAAHAIMENITPLIHKHLVPAQKMTAKMLGLKFELDSLARNNDLRDASGNKIAPGDYAAIEKAVGIDAQRQIAGKVVQQVDDRLGQQNYRNLYMNRYMRDIMQASLMSPGWQIGTIRTIGGGLKDVKKLATGGDTIHGKLDLGGRISNAKINRLTSRTAYLIGLHALVGGIAIGTTYALTGTGPQDIRDFYTIRTGRKNDDGTDERYSFPSYGKDVVELAHGGNVPKNLWNMTMNKMNPAFRVIGELSQNKDFYGNHIYDPDADTSVQARQIGEHLAGTLVPFSVTGLEKSSESGKSYGNMAANLMGINPAPGYMTATPFFDYLKSHAQDHGHETLNPDEAAHKQDFWRAVSAIREGKEPDVSMLSDKEQDKLDKYAETSAPEAKFGRLKLPEKIKAWENATDEERQQYNLQDHIFKGNYQDQLAELPEDEQDKLQAKLDEIDAWKPKDQTQQASSETP